MAEPAAANPIAVRIRAEIDPFVRWWPEANRIMLLRFIEGWTNPLMITEQYVRDNGDRPGYADVMHPDTAPPEWLPWLAMLVGLRLRQGASEVDQREQIRGMQGLKRGSVGATRSRIKQTLTGTKTVYFLERYGSPWRTGITTIASETPDPAATLRAAAEQKPIGIVLTSTVIAGGLNFDTLTYTHTNFNQITSLYQDFNEVLADPDKQP